MNLQKIDVLIGKFERGETSLEEEKQMKAFFLSHEVPFHLKKYQEIFSFYKISGEEKPSSASFDDNILKLLEKQEEKSNKGYVRKFYLYSAVAAAILILFGIFFRNQVSPVSNKETYNDPLIAYAETKKILLRVSNNFNAGFDKMSNMKEFNNGLNKLEKITTFQSGVTQLEKVTLFDKVKEMITTKNN